MKIPQRQYTLPSYVSIGFVNIESHHLQNSFDMPFVVMDRVINVVVCIEIGQGHCTGVDLLGVDLLRSSYVVDPS